MRVFRETAFFALQRVIGSRAGACYRQLLAMEKWPVDQLRAWQGEQLKHLLQQAAQQTPFYRDRCRLTTAASWSDFPIITKSSLSEHYPALMSDDMRKKYETKSTGRYGWLEVTSGGTTGVPTTVIHDADFRDKDRASRAYEQHLCGFPFGTPHFRLWGSMHDIQHTHASFSSRIMANLSRERLLNAFQMEDDRICEYIKIINNCRIEHMIAYVDAIEQIARFAINSGITIKPFRAIMTTGGTLTQDTRNLLHDVFSARIHNKYGSRDAGEIACECEEGALHILPHILTEVVDDEGKALPSGSIGRLLITFLGNHSFPLIRFDITDMAALSDQPCACGRPFPVLEKLEGRATDFLFSSNGGYVSPVYIRHVVGVVHGHGKIRRFQLVQQEARVYALTIQPETGMREENFNDIRAPLLTDLKAVLGQDAAIKLRFAETIPETASGKFRYIINQFRPS